MGGVASVQSVHVKKVEKVDETYCCEIEFGPFDISRNISVLFVCDEWSSCKGGLSTFNREFAVNFAKYSSNNIKVHCYVCDSNENRKQNAITDGVNLITAKHLPAVSDPMEGLKIPPDELRYPDVVVGHGRKFGVAAHFIANRAKCRWVQFVHVYCEALGKFKQDRPNSDAIAENDRKNKQELELCKKADLTVAVGAGLQQKFERRIKGIEVVTPGIFENFDIHRRALSQDRTKQDFRVFMFGRGSLEDFFLKGYDIVGKAIGLLERNFKLTFVGSPEDEHRKIEKWFRDETNIARNQLTIRGYCDYEEMKEMFSEADAIVMPSRTEGFGLVALEGISAGVPVLISTECGIAKALEEVNGGMSVVVDSESPEEWAKKIRELSEQSSGTRETNAMRLRENYGKKYDWERECKKFERMILDLMMEPRKFQAIRFSVSDPSGNVSKVEAVISHEGNGSLPTDANGNTVYIIHSVNPTGKKNEVAMSFTDSDTSDKTAGEITKRREKGSHAAGSTTLNDASTAGPKGSDKKAPNDEDRQQSHTDPDTSNETREQAKGAKEKVKAAGDTSANQDVKKSVDQLCSAARNGDITEIESLLFRGLCIDSRDIFGWSPLMLAATFGKVEAVQYLISRGADPASRDNSGWNSLHWASYGGHTDVIELLVSHMSDIEPRGALDETPLIVAVSMGKVEAVRCLINKGANPALRDKCGKNSLHFASFNSNKDTIDILLSHGVDIESKSKNGETPLMMARRLGLNETVSHLLSKGANDQATSLSRMVSKFVASCVVS